MTPSEYIATSLDRNLFVEAGAGTGKTKALVDRVVALVAAGVPITAIVAITFTEKAAAELRERVRQRLEALLRESPTEEVRVALESLDRAQISTIHAFAGAIVRAFSAEAGVDPDFGVIETIAAQRRFDQRWRDELEHLGNEEVAAEAFASVLRLGLQPKDIETLAKELWPRPQLAGVAEKVVAPPRPVWPDLIGYQAELHGFSLAGLSRNPAESLARLTDLVDRLVAQPAERDALLAASGVGDIKYLGGRDQRPAVATEIRDKLVAHLEALREVALLGLVPFVARFVLADAKSRRRDGTLTFDDLIAIARDLVVDNPTVRHRLREQYRALLIDEFQDTDPLQFAIARAFATDPQTGRVEPGRLFVVGDPKQSIYRFRKADMAVYDQARQLLAGGPENVMTLDRSRRSVEPIIGWVNRVFAGLFVEERGVSPAYVPMSHERDDVLDGPPVAFFGRDLDERAGEIRAIEARHVAAVCRQVVQGGWAVYDRREERTRNATFADIAILIPARSILPELERAFEREAIPFRVESGSLVFQTQELRDLTNILAAVDDPTDGVAVVAALRSPAFACSDEDLARHRLEHGSFDYLARSQPDGPVSEALARLRTLHERRPDLSLADLVQAILGETGLVASAMLDVAGRDAFRRARFVVQRARDFEADGPQPLRAFVTWLEERSATPEVDHEGASLDDDEDAVRVLTVHGAKGLEFPVVIMAGFGGQYPNVAAPVWAQDDEGHLAVCAGTSTRRFSAGPVDNVRQRQGQHEAAERIRVLYVAATRARDHLVVSLYRKFMKGGQINSNAARLADVEAHVGVPELPGPTTEHAEGRPMARLADLHVDPVSAADGAGLAAERAALVARATTLHVTSATALAGRKEGREDDTEPWSRGRGGTRVGRAVHAVIQSVSLDGSPAELRAGARAQAVAEAVPGREEAVLRLAETALASAAASRARAARRAIRELPFAIERDGVILEGFVDLVLDTPEGLEIVDWKTDAVTAAQVEARLDEYRLQAGLYALALERVTGRPVTRVTYAFLAPKVERDFTDIAALKEEAELRLAAPSNAASG